MSETEPRRPKVGVAVICIRGNEILLGKRTAGKLQGTYACPGGHLEWGESFEEAGVRECKEEAGLVFKPEDLKFVTAYNRVVPEEDHHYVVMFMAVRCGPEVVHVNAEPDKCEGWGWFDADLLPPETLPPIAWVIRDYGYFPDEGFRMRTRGKKGKY